MLGRIVTKLMFKAMVPLVVVGGVLFYADYMRGGDPAAVMSKISAGLGSQVKASFSSAQRDASTAVAGLSSRSSGSTDASASPGNSRFYTWQDVNGVTHYSSVEPADVNAQTVTVNPNANVLAPVQAPAAAQSARNGASVTTRRNDAALGIDRQPASKHATAVADLESEMGEPLPGIAGHLLSRQSTGDSGSAAMDPARVIKLLQSGGY